MTKWVNYGQGRALGGNYSYPLLTVVIDVGVTNKKRQHFVLVFNPCNHTTAHQCIFSGIFYNCVCLSSLFVWMCYGSKISRPAVRGCSDRDSGLVWPRRHGLSNSERVLGGGDGGRSEEYVGVCVSAVLEVRTNPGYWYFQARIQKQLDLNISRIWTRGKGWLNLSLKD